ncbi:MAG: TonB-dependent receptor [Marinobacter sp.]|uniref:TonB-dependent receptor plug domain-containing protein n=1 Tax=Marinobacter sp. TaxID=50741 RepID=UPI00299E0D9F|nr:TonB-dependent receptor [Marinobacter sp.]MDX1633606.1 TonB-dependent receptor [Marinobacter sp.]
MTPPAVKDRTRSIVFLGTVSFFTAPWALAQDTPESSGMDEEIIFDEAWPADQGLMFESDVPEVLTTTRLRQPKSRVPGTTTVLQGDLIRQLGILNLVEVFRLVPGMTVAEVGSNKPVTSYHGTVAFDQRRLQVQIDGRTAYQPNLAGVEWQAMPVAIENIERIEISRGPNAAAYGINAFLGTINIITRSPEDTQGVRLRTTYGSGGHKTLFGSVGDVSEDHGWRLSYQRRDDDGFDYQIEGGEEIPFHDGYSFNLVNYDANTRLTSNQSIDFRAGIIEGVDEEDRFKMGDYETNPDIDVYDYYLQARWNVRLSDRHFFHIQSSYQDYNHRQRWRWCPEGFGRCFDTNQDIDESRLEFELQDTITFNPSLRLVSGIDYRHDQVVSDTYFNGEENNYQGRIFGNLEYTPIERLTLNFGGSWERTTNLEGNFFSPRVAANFQLAEQHTLRFVYSKAVRIPSTFEQNADWGYRMTNVTPPGPNGEFEGERFMPSEFEFVQTEPFDEERITSHEISYFGQKRFAGGLASLEVKYFHDYIRDVISGFLNPEDWNLENNTDLLQRGFEVETSVEFQASQFRVTYAYMDQDGTYTGEPQIPALTEKQKRRFIDLESRLTAEHSGSLAWIQRYAYDISSATAFYWTDSLKENQFQRIDFRLAKAFHQPRLSYELAFIMQHYMDDQPPQSVDNNIRDLNQYFVEASLRF